MAVCTPQALVRSAACMECIPPGWADIVAISQLAAFTGTTQSVAQLAKASGSYRSLSDRLGRAAIAYLVAQNGGYPTDPGTLLKAANCLVPCLTTGQRRWVLMYLWALNTGITPNASAMLRAAAPYQAVMGQEEAILLYLLDGLDGNYNVAKAAAGASCLSCALNDRQLEDVLIYLLCQGLGMNIVPPGSVYGPTGEFDITILPNTYYQIKWGANDVSATVCGQTYPSTGAGTITLFYSASCTLLQLFGNAAGTTVTAQVMVVHNREAPPANFAFTLTSATVAQASWASPPVTGTPYVVSTQVWTSTDGVNYSLAGTVAAPGTTLNVTAPTLGNVLYAKALWIYSDGNNGGFSPAYEVFGAVTDWANRVVTNGGGAVSSATMQAMNTFYRSLNAGGTIIGKIKAMCCVTPGGFIEATTPLIKAFGNDPWAGSAANFNLTVNGLQASSANSFLNTGVIPSACFASTSTGGLTAYVYTTTANDSAAVDIGVTQGATFYCALYSNFFINPNEYGLVDMYNNTNNFGAFPSPGTGFFSGSVVAGTGQLYVGSSSGFNTLGAARAGAAGNLPTIAIYAMGINSSGATAGTTTVRRYSFFALHDGLTAKETQNLFNAVDALRIALGGGRV
jgi:hypothetical protein